MSILNTILVENNHYVCMCIYILALYTNIYIYIHLSIYLFKCLFLDLFNCLFIYLCIIIVIIIIAYVTEANIYIYTYVYIYILHLYIYTYIHIATYLFSHLHRCNKNHRCHVTLLLANSWNCHARRGLGASEPSPLPAS